MWPDFFRIIREVGPAWVLAENVPSSLYGINRIQSDLQSAGYISAAINIDTALPERQRARNRAIYVAYADSNGESWRSFYAKTPGISQTATGMGEAIPVPMGMADGISAGMDRNRLRALGNAVVPQIPEIIGRAIIAAHGANT
jgi:DNA (cytosine-5)-methyltransferase 1